MLELGARKPQWQGVPWEYQDQQQQQQRSLEEYECSADGQCEMMDNEGRLKMIETNELPFKRRDNIGFPTIASFDVSKKKCCLFLMTEK